MPIFLLNNWKYIVIALLSLWVYTLRADLKAETALKEGIISALTAQSNIIESNRVDYEHNLAEASKTNTVIQTRFKDRVKVIYEIGEKNEDANQSMHTFNHYTF